MLVRCFTVLFWSALFQFCSSLSPTSGFPETQISFSKSESALIKLFVLQTVMAAGGSAAPQRKTLSFGTLLKTLYNNLTFKHT